MNKNELVYTNIFRKTIKYSLTNESDSTISSHIFIVVLLTEYFAGSTVQTPV